MSLLFHVPRLHVAYGAISLSLAPELERCTVNRILLIAEGSAGFAARLERLKDGLPQETEFVLLQLPAVRPDATIVTGARGLFALEDCDGVVAAGGAAIMDFAKFVLQGLGNDSACRDDDVSRQGRSPCFMAIPGDLEAIRALGPAMIAKRGDSDATPNPGPIPDVVICDTDFVHTGSALSSAALGMCILSDCIEAYAVHWDDPRGDAVAINAIRRIQAHLEQMASASRIGASDERLMTALLQCTFAMHEGIGAVRAIENAVATAHPGAVSPGQVSAALLPIVLEFSACDDDGGQARIREALGQPPGEAAAYVRRLAARLQLPAWLSELGLKREDVGALASLAFAGSNTATGSRSLTVEDYTALLNASFPCLS